MRIVSLSQAKAQLSKYGRLCHEEQIIVTVNGVPSFQLVPFDEEDDLVDQLLEFNPKFQELLKKRLRERSISAKAARTQL